MSNIPFSIRLDPSLKERLNAEAKSSDRTPSYLAIKAIEAFLGAREAKRQVIAAAIEDAEKGDFVSQNAVHGWLDTWGSDRVGSPPAPDLIDRKRSK